MVRFDTSTNTGLEGNAGNPLTKPLMKQLPNGLEPKGNGWYGSPDVVSPRDCDNYPSSIYCGGNPVGKPPGTGVGISVNAGFNECGFFSSATGNIAGFQLPTHTRAYVRPECREDYEQKQYDRKNPPPEPPPDFTKGYKPEPGYAPNGFDDNDIVCVVTVDIYYIEEQKYLGKDVGWAIGSSWLLGQCNQALYPTGDLVKWYVEYLHTVDPYTIAVASTQGTATVKNFLNSQWRWFYFSNSNDYNADPPEPSFSSVTLSYDLRIAPDLPNETAKWNRQHRDNPALYNQGGRYQLLTPSITDFGGVYPLAIWVGRFGDIFPSKQISPIDYGTGETKDNAGRVIGRNLRIWERKVQFCKKADGYPPRNNPHFDSPPPPKRDCCMQCCGSGQQQQNNNDDMLRKLLKELQDIKKYLGYREKITVPEHLCTSYDDNGNKQNPGTINVSNMTDFMAWIVKAFDSILGEWGIGFWLEDADPEEEGAQSKFIHAPNLAELAADMYGLIFQMYLNQYEQLQLSQRSGIETMLARKVGLQNYYSLDALIDWAGFKRHETTKKIPFLLDINANPKKGMPGFMKEAEIEIQISEFHPDAKTSPSFKDDLLRMKRAAAIIEAVYGRKINKDADIADAIKKTLIKSLEHHEKVNNDKYQVPNKEKEKDDFDEWLESAESEFQFTRIDEGTVSTTPYGRPYNERPKLRRVGTSQQDGEKE